MTIAMSEQVDAEPCDVLRGSDGPVYFLLGGRLYVVHEILGRWIEPDVEPRRRGRHAAPQDRAESDPAEGLGAGAGGRVSRETGQTAPRQRKPADSEQGGNEKVGRALAGQGQAGRERAGQGQAQLGQAGPEQDALDREEPAQVEHWLVIASIGRFGTPAVFRLQRRPAPPADGPDRWTVRAERR